MCRQSVAACLHPSSLCLPGVDASRKRRPYDVHGRQVGLPGIRECLPSSLECLPDASACRKSVSRDVQWGSLCPPRVPESLHACRECPPRLPESRQSRSSETPSSWECPPNRFVCLHGIRECRQSDLADTPCLSERPLACDPVFVCLRPLRHPRRDNLAACFLPRCFPLPRSEGACPPRASPLRSVSARCSSRVEAR